MARRSDRGGSLPHDRYGAALSGVPTYVEPFTAYRSWIWTSDGVMSLFNGVPWAPKVPFEAKCLYGTDLLSMQAAGLTPELKALWERPQHRVPDPSCTCGTYAGINMQQMIDLKYTQFGVHGEVSLWGRLYRHALGWRSQYAYPKYFVIPAFVIPVKVEEAQKHIAKLTAYDVDIHIQPAREAKVGQQTIPLWIRDYGYTNQGISFLVERWKKPADTEHRFQVGDASRVEAVSMGAESHIGGGEAF